MIIQKLVELFDRLENDGYKLPLPGFSETAIDFSVEIDMNGNFIQLHDLRGDKKRPFFMLPVTRLSRGNSIYPHFIWDSSDYIMGIGYKGGKEIKRPERKEKFITQHESILEEFHNKKLEALIKFMKSDEPDKIIQFMRDNNYENVIKVVFDINGEYIHNDEDLKEYWKENYFKYTGIEMKMGKCIVTGEYTKIPNQHESIKIGTMGRKLVSFNKSFWYSDGYSGKDLAYCSPMSVDVVSKYSRILDYMYYNDKCVEITKNNVVFFWTNNGNIDVNDIFKLDNEEKIKEFFDYSKSGIFKEVDIDEKFYILWIIKDRGRLRIKSFYESTIGEIYNNVLDHMQNIEMESQKNKFPTINRLLLSIKKKKEKSESLPKAEMLYSVIYKLPYPNTLLQKIINIQNTQKNITKKYEDCKNKEEKDNKFNVFYRLSLLRAILKRNYKKEVSKMLDKDRNDVGYLLGRLFAVYCKIQEEGNESNNTLEERFWMLVINNPLTGFLKLKPLVDFYLKNIKKTNGGRVTNFKRMIEQIFDKIDFIPKELNLVEQGEFSIGFYQETKNFYTKGGENVTE